MTGIRNRGKLNTVISLSLLGLILLVLMFTCTMIGASGISLDIILQVRLPRVILGTVVGASLAVSGAVFQGILRNPLADPYILGTSTGGALGATIGLFIGRYIFSLEPIVIPLFAFLGSFATVFIVYRLARVGGRIPRDSLILAGIIVSAFLGSLIMFILSLSGRETHEILYILMGSLGVVFTNDTLLLLGIIIVLSIAGFILIYVRANNLNLMAIGEESAQSLGIDVEREKILFFFAASIMTGAVVSMSGLIGFVGLIVPHMIRMAFGPDHRFLIPASAFAGGILLILSDTLARTVMVQEIPVGVITSLFGAPFFLYLLRKKRR
jgi:iron complex transport system permease protein